MLGILRNATANEFGFIIEGETAEQIERVAYMSLRMTFTQIRRCEPMHKPVQATWIDPNEEIWELAFPSIIHKPNKL